MTTRAERLARAEAILGLDGSVTRTSTLSRSMGSCEDRPASTQAFAEQFRNFPLRETPPFQANWYAAFDDPTLDRLYVQGPREHGKTSTVLTYALRRLVDNQRLRVGVVSGSEDLAARFVTELRHELETNELLREIYNGGHSFVGPKWTEKELVLSGARTRGSAGEPGLSGKDVSVFAVGRGGQISSRHCDLLIVDDVESADSVRTDAVRQATRQWWSRELVPVLSPTGKLIVVGTRKHHDDLYGRLITDERWEVLDVARSVFRADGSPIWPEMWDAAALAARKAELDAVDVLAWPQEYLNTPVPSESQMFFPEAWPVYGSPPAELDVFQFWDLAISERETADYTVGVTIGRSTTNDVYLLDLVRGHWNFNRTLAEIEAMGRAWPTVQLIGIEHVAYQAAAFQEAVRRTLLPIVPVNLNRAAGATRTSSNDKVTRARLLEARAVAGKVHRPAVAHWWPGFAAEAAYFPAGAHDDQVDAVVGAIRLAGTTGASIPWQYHVWTCLACKHMFVFEQGRPCPRCGRPCPDKFDNPDNTSDGGLVLNREVTAEQERIMATIRSGGRIDWIRDLAEWVYWRADTEAVIGYFVAQGDGRSAHAAREEIDRIDRLYPSRSLR